MRGTVEKLREGWYGGGPASEKEAVSCIGLIEKAHTEMNKRIANDEFLTGTIKSLTTAGVPEHAFATVEQLREVDLTLGDGALLDSGNGAGADGIVVHELAGGDAVSGAFDDEPLDGMLSGMTEGDLRLDLGQETEATLDAMGLAT